MPTFEVVSAEKKKSFTGKSGGEFDVWNIQLRNGEGVITAELVQRAGSAAPSGSVEGTVEPGEYGTKFKKAQAAGGGSAFRGKTPKEGAEIVRMNAHRHALSYLAYKHAATGENTVNSWSEYVKLVNAFYDDIRGVQA